MAALLIPSLGLASEARMVTDLSTGAVLVAEDVGARRFPASLTKLMTLYLLFEAVDSGRVALNQPLVISKQAAMQPPTKLGLRAGKRIAVEDAIGALILRSANDIATAVAEGLEGSEPAFAAKMTAKARQLGMNQTVFRNATGLPDPDQFTTARDLSTLAKALIGRFPKYYRYFGMRTCRVAGRTISSHNNFLWLYRGADGLKTGYTRDAGYNLAASAERGGHRLVGVVLGGSSRRERDYEMVRIMDEGFVKAGVPRDRVAPARRHHHHGTRMAPPHRQHRHTRTLRASRAHRSRRARS